MKAEVYEGDYILDDGTWIEVWKIAGTELYLSNGGVVSINDVDPLNVRTAEELQAEDDDPFWLESQELEDFEQCDEYFGYFPED